MARGKREALRIGVALGGGGVRGMAHILALETIDTFGILPVAMSGTSMGAIIGALYASGFSGKQLRALVESHTITRRDRFRSIFRKRNELMQWMSFVRPQWPKGGLLKADRFLEYLHRQLAVERFEDLEIPLQVVATDFHQAKPVVFDKGVLRPAIQASMSIPGVFAAVEHGGRVLVDGGLVNNLPYDLLIETCDVTIAIDVTPSTTTEGSNPPSTLDAILASFDILLSRATESMLAEHPPTIHVKPDLQGIRTLDFSKIQNIFELAKPAMETLAEQLDQLLNQ
jgi:NTE family protein